MAIDGVNIIDSDDGHGIYNFIVESYKDGVNVDNIISDMLKRKQIIASTIFTQKSIGPPWPILYGKLDIFRTK